MTHPDWQRIDIGPERECRATAGSESRHDAGSCARWLVECLVWNFQLLELRLDIGGCARLLKGQLRCLMQLPAACWSV